MSDPDLSRELLIRLFTEAGGAAYAAQLEKRLLQGLQSFAARPRAPAEAYWKKPGWFEHFYALAPADERGFDAVTALAGGAWHITRDEECNAVWTPAQGQVFLLPEVRWVEVLLIYPNPPDQDEEYLAL